MAASLGHLYTDDTVYYIMLQKVEIAFSMVQQPACMHNLETYQM